MTDTNHANFKNELKRKAAELGFPLTGVVQAGEPGRLLRFQEWLASGYAGEMQYMHDRREAYQHPRYVLDGCKSLLMLGMPYRTQETEFSADARVARYAHSHLDYHDNIHQRLKELCSWVKHQMPHALVRGVVDTAPLLEREFAEQAGLGWVGKNTLLLNKEWGSYFFLAALLMDVEIAADDPWQAGHCGTCTACLDHCPTKAFPKPYVLDASRCISYVTIEHRGTVDEELSVGNQDWIFGCDVCQEVCPWNRKASLSNDSAFEPAEHASGINVVEVLQMNEAQFRERFRKTPMWRAKRRGMLRNALIVAVNQGIVESMPAIEKLLKDEEPLLREAAAWAIRQLS